MCLHSIDLKSRESPGAIGYKVVIALYVERKPFDLCDGFSTYFGSAECLFELRTKAARNPSRILPLYFTPFQYTALESGRAYVDTSEKMIPLSRVGPQSWQRWRRVRRRQRRS